MAAPQALAPAALPDARAPVHNPQAVAALAAIIPQTSYSYNKANRVHGVQIWHNPDRGDIGGLQPEMHLWLHYPVTLGANSPIKQEHLIIRDVMAINNIPHFQLDRVDVNHTRYFFGEYHELSEAIDDLAQRYWVGVNTNHRRKMYSCWHVYENPDYTATPVNHGTYLGNMEHFRKDFCFANGWSNV